MFQLRMVLKMAASKFTTKQGAMNKRKHCWACIKCTAVYTAKQSKCIDCGSKAVYFPSQSEFVRFRNLQMQQMGGLITDLELQPKFPIVLNGIKVCEYRADFKYNRGELPVIEDVKGSMNEKYHDPVFKLKKKLVEAVYRISISIVT